MKYLLAVLMWLVCCDSARATSLELSQVPPDTAATEAVEVWVDFMTSAKNATYYLAGKFYKTKGSNLFGFTQVGEDWISADSTPSSFFSITTSQEGSWSGKIKVKPDIEDLGFQGQGEYFLRIDRFTGKSDSPAESSNSVGIILLHSPPPSPTPTTTPQPSPLPSIATQPTAAPTPRQTPTPRPTQPAKPTPTPSASIGPPQTARAEVSPESSVASMPTKIALDSSSQSGEVAGMIDYETKANPKKPNKMAPTLLVIGSVMLAGGVIPLSLKLFPRVE